MQGLSSQATNAQSSQSHLTFFISVYIYVHLQKMTDHVQKQVNFADCYVLTNRRTTAFITSFLDTFLRNRQEAAKQYEVPQFSEHPRLVLYTAQALIPYLEQHPTEPHAIYWLNKDESTLRGAMCIFTSDGQMILGLYCETLRPDVTIERQYLKALKDFCRNTEGLILYEEPAPQDTAAFLERLKTQA
jgi:hypothetical protein